MEGPTYLVDTRARHNYHSPRRRLFIAVLMIWWGLIIPALIALALAGPGPPRRSRGLLASYDREPRRYTYEPDYDDRAAQANAKRYAEHQQLRPSSGAKKPKPATPNSATLKNEPPNVRR